MSQPFDSDLLELRIHGVRNTPAHEMLRTQASNVVSSRGDRLAGFSTARRPTVPHRLEAYVWGRLARFTGLPTLGRIGDALVRVLWFSLAPFGLANAAYWARLRLGTGSGTTEQERTEDLIGRGPGSGLIRLLGLLLTLLYVTTAATVAFDMDLTSNLDLLPQLSLDWRAGVLVPVAALIVVALLSHLARTRYIPGPRLAPGERAVVGPTTRGDAQDAGPHIARGAGQGPSSAPSEVPDADTPLLAHRSLWRVGSGMRQLSWLHAAAALAWIGGIMAMTRVDAALVAGGGLSWTVSGAQSTGWQVILGASVLVVVVTGVLIVRSQTHDPQAPTPVAHWVSGALGFVVLVAAIVWTIVDGEAGPGGRGGALAATVVCMALGILVLAILLRSTLVARTMPAADRATLGWHGQGPFVFAICAVGFGLLLSFATVLAVGWLVVDADPPMVFTLYAAGFALLVAGSALVLASVLLRAWKAGRGRAVGELVDVRLTLVSDAGHWARDTVIDAAAREVWASRRLASLLRRAEIAVHGLAVAIAAGLWAGVVLGLLWLTDWPAAEWFWGTARVSGAVGLWTGALLIAGLVAVSSRAESRPFAMLWDLMCFLPTQAHPFGPPCYSERVVPEMTERISAWLDVDGTGAGEHEGGGGPDDGNDARRVVLSAHSMGLVLTVCVLFHLSACGVPQGALDRIGLLSYGIQPRRYFARYFPQVLGPQVLSIVPARTPRAGGRDPWPPLLEDEVAQEAAAGWTPRPGAPGPTPGALWNILGERWTNLYRPNDPLGFPVRYGRRAPAAGMDVQAEEFVPDAYQFTVATHGHYLETWAYTREFRTLVKRLGPRNGAEPQQGADQSP